MLLDLSEIVMRHGMRTGLDVDQPSVEDPDLTFAEPLKGHLEFSNEGDVLNILGKVDTRLLIPCNRCLTDVRMPLEVEVDEHFPIDEVTHPNRPPKEGEDFDGTVSTVVYLDQGKPILDLDELLRQLIVSEIPIRTVCDEACAGLCPQCGRNLNEGRCTCAPVEQHTPLAKLAVLLGENGAVEDEKA
jgi:uncharacterized protein